MLSLVSILTLLTNCASYYKFESLKSQSLVCVFVKLSLIVHYLQFVIKMSQTWKLQIAQTFKLHFSRQVSIANWIQDGYCS